MGKYDRRHYLEAVTGRLIETDILDGYNLHRHRK